MRSSTFSSSRSSSKYMIRDAAMCPIKNMAIISTKRSRHCVEEPVICDGQIQKMNLITYENGQFVANQQALAFLSKASKDLQIQFMGCLGNSTIGHHFIGECLKQCKQRLATGIHLNIKQDCQYKQGIFMYNFAIRKMNKLVYFIWLQQSEQNGSMFHFLSILSSSLTIFVDDQERKSQFLQRMFSTIKGLNNPPSICHIICNNKIKTDEDFLYKLQSVFDELILTSIDMQNGYAKNKEKARLYMQSISTGQTRKQQNQFFKAKYMHHLLRNSYNIAKHQTTVVKNQEVETSLLVKSAYDQLLAEANAQYEEYFNQLNFQRLQYQDQLLQDLQKQQERIVSRFNSNILNSQFHQAYLQRLMALIEDYQAKIITRVEQNTYEKVEYSMENTGEPQEAELENQADLLLAIEEIKGNNKSNHNTIEKIFILARNAARINLLGYDEKAKIAQLRTAIDQKWEQLDTVRMQKVMKKEVASEENLLRQKYEMMEAKSSNLQTKITLLSQEILHFKSIVIYHSNTSNEKQGELQQLQRIHEKNQSLLQFVASTYLQQPVIASIEDKIRLMTQGIKQLTFKKQVILQSLHEHSE